MAHMTSILTIDKSALAANYKLFGSITGKPAAGIVKANAYGLGIDEVTSVLEAANCPLYFTALPDEALHLRTLTKRPIAVLGGLPSAPLRDFLRNDIIPALNSLGDIDIWRQAAELRGVAMPAIIHFDTGMNRLGLPAEETVTLLKEQERLKGLNVILIMSHFACADEKDHPLTAQQYKNFSTIARYFPRAQKSLANSSGIFRSPDYHFDIVRPGMALYGLNPTPETKSPVRPVVSLSSPLLQVKDVPAGQSVGYGAAHICTQKTKVGTVALGYADGFFRSNSGKGALYFKGQPCPIIGRVSMDLVTVDLGTHDAQPGDKMEVLGLRQSADDLAAISGTIGYEILTNLGARYKRVYK